MSRLQDAEEKLIDNGNSEAAETLETFEIRWKYAVFPAMIAFAVLSAFGFYLIYGMLQRMEDLSKNVYQMTQVIHTTMPSMNTNMTNMSGDIHQLNTTITENFPDLDQKVTSMSKDMKTLSYSTASMAMTTHNMGQNVWELNKNVSKPFSAIGNMIPWSSKGSTPPPAPYYYQQQQINKNVGTPPIIN